MIEYKSVHKFSPFYDVDTVFFRPTDPSDPVEYTKHPSKDFFMDWGPGDAADDEKGKLGRISGTQFVEVLESEGLVVEESEVFTVKIYDKASQFAGQLYDPLLSKEDKVITLVGTADALVDYSESCKMAGGFSEKVSEVVAEFAEDKGGK